MEIVEDKVFRLWMLEKIATREFKERTGVHQSDLVYCLNKQALRKLKPLPNTDEEVLIFSIGWATQRWLTGQAEDEPEKEVDGITVTLDALIDDVPWELKATYQSAGKAIEENIHWLRQIMSQCYVTGTTAAYLSRFEIMGDWKWVFGKKEEKAVAKRPTLHCFRLEFSKAELAHFWQGFMIPRRGLYVQILETGKLLPPAIALASGQEWECGWCAYRGKECRKEE